MAVTTKHFYEFGPYRLDPAERRLWRDGELVPLTPKCFDLLVYLVEHSGHLLGKDELLACLWPGQFVEEGSLSFSISALRKALDDGRDGGRYIETVRKKGFRFVAPVEERWEGGSEPDAEEVTPPAPPAPAARSRWSPGSKALAVSLAVGALGLLAYAMWTTRGAEPAERPPRTIAVLPFKPLTADSRDEPLELGMCNALIARLSRLSQLVVRPTSSVVRYNKLEQDALVAGRELGVEALLDGYVQRSGDRIRVTAQLLRIADGKSLWSGQYDEKFTDVFAVQDSISRQMVAALALRLTGDEQRQVTKRYTGNVEAYELYLKGRYFQDKRTSEGLTKSIEYFQDAIERDPDYALAFAGLAVSYVTLAIRADMPPRESYLRAKAAATRALEIDDTIAEAHTSLAYVRYWFDWDWPGAESEFKRAIETQQDYTLTHHYYASYLIAMGRQQEAISEARRAQQLEPLSPTAITQTARILFFAREYDEAIEQCRKALEIDPNFAGAHLFLGRAYKQKGLYREALVELETARQLFGESAEVLALIGYTYAAAGRRLDAYEMARELEELSKERYVSPYHPAMVYAGLGEREKALDGLEAAYEDREGRMTILKLAPEFDGLRADPRVTQLLERMHLT